MLCFIFSLFYILTQEVCLYPPPPPITPCEVKGIDIQQNLKDSFINFDDLYKCSSVGYQLCLARQDPVACVWLVVGFTVRASFYSKLPVDRDICA